MEQERISPNQVVAWNLRRARIAHGWTQQQAAEQLEPHIGERWSVAVFSAAERSIDGKRVRHFTANELHAFARTFDQPISYFFCPPPWAGGISHPESPRTTPTPDYMEMLFDVGEDAHTWLLSEVVPMTAETTRALRQWGDHFAAMVAHRESQVAALAAVADEREEKS